MDSAACQAGGRFRRCRENASHVCQYCGRGFCDLHTHYVEGFDAVCNRKRCVAKHDDLQRHIDYKADVTRRNRTGRCGEPGCDSLHPPSQCSLCQGFFCSEHLVERLYAVHEGWVKVEKRVSVCAWCWQRRKIWQRR